ncbi:MAG: 3-hydroxyacyl-CoA dehydrogenase/enoyl-CoA hydratase family protein [Balneolaceae bacterium]|nr:MAG: 3-hydroxyacyl-CoA dehydrogenase/enoyl-CoA hydratase family protein [Balneolaceae bacterium]
MNRELFPGNRIQQVVVLGSGIMGSQIAAHCVNAGLKVKLMDLKSDDPDRPDLLAEKSIQNLLKMRPSPLAVPSYSRLIETGNFDDHMNWLQEADWICEVVVERMEIKKPLIKKIGEYRKPGSIVSSNTSGLPIDKIGKSCSEEFRQHFLGTHFFNPPRYMKLLELIPTKATNPAVTELMTRFCEQVLGKGVVVCNDTPNFIANRIGVFSMASMMPWFFEGKLRAEEIDYLTGTLTGYSKAASFRTADMAGLDVLKHVTDNLRPAVPDDERRDVFQLPEGFGKMVERGAHGNKKGQGFYKKVKSEKGSEYLVIHPQSLDYEPQVKIEIPSAKKAEKDFKTPGERLKFLVNQKDKAGLFLWEIQCDLLLYSANRIPEISDSVEEIDRAMQWGFNWELGPFQRWDAIGVAESVIRMENEGRTVPETVKKMLASGRESFYQSGTVYNLIKERAEPVTPPARNAIRVSSFKKEKKEIWATESAALYDAGDGVALFEFRTKQQTLGFELVKNLDAASAAVKENFGALVLGHDHDNFSYGANLAEAAAVLKKGDFGLIRDAVEQFQRVAVGLRYQPFPVVAAVSGRTFGGGVEFFMHCDRVVAHHELYCGLVELGVGLIPAGGGTKELLLRAMRFVKFADQADPLPFVREAFKTIGMAKVSDSAANARGLGFLRDTDLIVMNRDLLIKTAIEEARMMAGRTYTPPAEPMIRVMGETGLSALKIMLFNMNEAGFATEYDKLLAEKTAFVMSGGNLSEPQEVPESWILKLEREAILECFRDQRTHARMEQLLKTGKPLRN